MKKNRWLTVYAVLVFLFLDDPSGDYYRYGFWEEEVRLHFQLILFP